MGFKTANQPLFALREALFGWLVVSGDVSQAHGLKWFAAMVRIPTREREFSESQPPISDYCAKGKRMNRPKTLSSAFVRTITRPGRYGDYPRFGNKRVDLVTTADVMACLSPIWHQRPETASRVKQRISAVMKWSIAQGFQEDNPADERVTAALGSNKKRPQHMKASHHSKVAAAVGVVEATDAHWATIAAFKFLTLTATRSGEVRNATWDEIDLSTATWTIPSEHTKTQRAHRVPLSTGALAVLATALPKSGGKGLVFPSPTGRTLSNATMSKLCKENNVGCVPHGMRTSFRDWCGETGVSREVAERALGHEIRNAVEKAYARTDLLDRRRQIMEKSSRYLAR